MAERQLTQEYVRSLFDYDLQTGEFRWRERDLACFKNKQACGAWNTKYAGTTAGTKRADGYVIIRVSGVNQCAHRLAWLYVVGEIGRLDIDHIDRNPSNNAFHNLRPATRSQNIANSSLRADNTSGSKGVTRARNGRWRAMITIGGSNRHIGTFDTVAEASAAYASAADNAFDRYASMGA